jgi:hypothetical protein
MNSSTQITTIKSDTIKSFETTLHKRELARSCVFNHCLRLLDIAANSRTQHIPTIKSFVG